MSADYWANRWKRIAKYYRRRLQASEGRRCELCELWITADECGVCQPCTKILVDAMSEPVNRVVLNPESDFDKYAITAAPRGTEETR